MKHTKYAGTKISFLGNFGVFRHANTEPGEPGKSDNLRQLTPEGEEQAAICRSKIAGLNMDLVISSPAQRAYETARIVSCFEKPHTLDILGIPEDMHDPLNIMFTDLGYFTLQNPQYNPARKMGQTNKPGYLEHPLHEALEDWSAQALAQILLIVEQDSAIMKKPLDVVIFGHAVLVNTLMRQLLYDLSGPQSPFIMQMNMTSTIVLGEAQGFVLMRDPTLTKLAFVDTMFSDLWRAPAKANV